MHMRKMTNGILLVGAVTFLQDTLQVAVVNKLILMNRFTHESTGVHFPQRFRMDI